MSRVEKFGGGFCLKPFTGGGGLGGDYKKIFARALPS